LIGYDGQAQGLLTSGGSMANLNALLIAHRAKADVPVAQVGIRGTTAPMTIYASDQVHLSVSKAADILGLGRTAYVFCPATDAFASDTTALSCAIDQDRRCRIQTVLRDRQRGDRSHGRHRFTY
jgi:glutamate/tyrosine decarboxylase-like PLP-dependent enzyme